MHAAPIAKSAAIRYALDLEGQIAGPISSLESGFISGQVREQNLPQSPYPKKNNSAPLFTKKLPFNAEITCRQRSILGFSRPLQAKHLMRQRK